jgi:hypothetical protein
MYSPNSDGDLFSRARYSASDAPAPPGSADGKKRKNSANRKRPSSASKGNQAPSPSSGKDEKK